MRKLQARALNWSRSVASVVGWLYLHFGWKEAFIGTGAMGFFIFAAWIALYRLPRFHPWLAQAELEHIEKTDVMSGEQSDAKTPWWKILTKRPAWGFTAAKFMTDPIWWFYIFWLPKYLVEARGFTIAKLEWFGMIPFIAAVPGSIFGGWLSGYLIRRGWSVNAGRKTAMLVCALSMPTGVIAAFAGNPWIAIALISVSTSAHQGWSANVFTLTSDIFPKKDVATVVGIGGCAGAIGGGLRANRQNAAHGILGLHNDLVYLFPCFLFQRHARIHFLHLQPSRHMLFQHAVKIRAAEAVRADTQAARRSVPGPFARFVIEIERRRREIDVGVGFLGIQRRRQHFVIQRQRRFEQAGRTCARLQVSKVALD